MNEFIEYLATETRKDRLNGLQLDCYKTLVQATDRRKNMEEKASKARTAEIQALKELQAVTDRRTEISDTAQAPVYLAIEAASIDLGRPETTVVVSRDFQSDDEAVKKTGESLEKLYRDGKIELPYGAGFSSSDIPTLDQTVDVGLDESQSPTNQI